MFRAKFKSLFGKLTIRFGFKKCHTDLEGFRESYGYEVVARDGNSVAVVFLTDADEVFQIQHIHFEDDYYWICLGNLREYFRRVD